MRFSMPVSWMLRPSTCSDPVAVSNRMAWGATVMGEGFYPLVTKREASGARLLGETAKRNSDGGYASEPDADCLSAADSLSQDQRGEEHRGHWCD